MDFCGNCDIVATVIDCGSYGLFCDCSSCFGDATLQTNTQIINGERIEYRSCELSIMPPIPKTCPDECPDTTWVNVQASHYRVRCIKNSLGARCDYECHTGYFGTGKNCTRCPSSGGIYGTTDNPGATQITECYLPSGTEFSDSTGSGVYTGKCYYKN